MSNSIKFLNEGFSKYFEKLDIEDNSSLLESIKSVLSRLNEKGMSDEDKRESDILRDIYRKIDGKKLNPKNLSDEEKKVLDKYGIDAWGFKGDTVMVTPEKNDLVTYDEIPHGPRKRNKFNKINFADRARKIDSREYARNIRNQSRFDQKSFDEIEREVQAREMGRNASTMRNALLDRERAQRNIDNSDKDYQDRIDSIKQKRDKHVDDIINYTSDKIKNSSKRLNDNEVNIQKLLDKHRLKKAIESLSEAEMSDEDKHDNELLKSIYTKIQSRANAKLTPEEQEVLDKYNLYRTDTKELIKKDSHKRVMSDNDFKSRYDYTKDGYRKITPDARKINYADRARKIDDRDYAQRINNRFNSERTFQSKERDAEADLISKDARAMHDYLTTRHAEKKWIDGLQKDLLTDIERSNKKYIKDIEAEERRKQYNLDLNKKRRDNAQKTIDKLLNKNESLEDDKGLIRLIPTGLSGKINNEILNSVIGQMSDGIWENSPGMEKYWMPVSIHDDNSIVLTKGDRYYYKAYADMSDEDIKKFFANKIKAIAQQCLHDHKYNPYTNWNSKCDLDCNYLNYYEKVTIADAYKAYQQLK